MDWNCVLLLLNFNFIGMYISLLCFPFTLYDARSCFAHLLTKQNAAVTMITIIRRIIGIDAIIKYCHIIFPSGAVEGMMFVLGLLVNGSESSKSLNLIVYKEWLMILKHLLVNVILCDVITEFRKQLEWRQGSSLQTKCAIKLSELVEMLRKIIEPFSHRASYSDLHHCAHASKWRSVFITRQ